MCRYEEKSETEEHCWHTLAHYRPERNGKVAQEIGKCHLTARKHGRKISQQTDQDQKSTSQFDTGRDLHQRRRWYAGAVWPPEEFLCTELQEEQPKHHPK